MYTVGSRLKALRNSTNLSQKSLAEKAGVTQSAINRYENDQSELGYRILLWYADFFDVSLDYIFCRTENPQGKLYEYRPETLKAKTRDKEKWAQFVEACFEEGSPLNAKLKEAIINMAGDREV